MQLLTGWDFLQNAFGGGDAFDGDAARECWESLRDDITAKWLRDRPLSRPWAWWRYERGMARPYGASVHRIYLHAHGLLSPAEVELVEADPSLLVANPYDRDLRPRMRLSPPPSRV